MKAPLRFFLCSLALLLAPAAAFLQEALITGTTTYARNEPLPGGPALGGKS